MRLDFYLIWNICVVLALIGMFTYLIFFFK